MRNRQDENGMQCKAGKAEIRMIEYYLIVGIVMVIGLVVYVAGDP